MTLNQNVNEAGWFYHAPARRTNNEAVEYPSMSQVPGLAEDNGPPEEPPRSLFKESDTKYVRLAKQGGRPNLLQMKENSGDRKDAVLYPKNDWYYLQDNAMEDDAEKEKNNLDYEFLRPEYMVHDGFKKDPNNFYQRPSQGPIAYDGLSIFEREPGKHATDKTVRLPELKKQGYGVRSGKPLKGPRIKPRTAVSANGNPGRGPNPGASQRPLKYLAMPEEPKEEKGQPRMTKLLGYAYEREWHDSHKDWQDKQEVGRTRHAQMTSVPQASESNLKTEYSVNFGKRTAVHYDPTMEPHQSARSSESSHKSLSTVRQTETQRLREARLQKAPEKEAFKLTRFKNIPARIDTKRTAAV